MRLKLFVCALALVSCLGVSAQTITLSHHGMDDENTLDHPERITPKNGTLKLDVGKGSTLLLDDIPAMSFRLYKVKK